MFLNGVSVFSDVSQLDGDRDVVRMWWMPAEVMSHSGECQHASPAKAASVLGRARYWNGWGVTARGAGGDGWEQGKRRTRHEIEWGWRTEKSWPAQGGGRRQWDRDGETEGGERMRVRERLTYSKKLLMFAPQCCTVVWICILLRQYQVSVWGKYSSSAVRGSTCQ